MRLLICEKGEKAKRYTFVEEGNRQVIENEKKSVGSANAVLVGKKK